MPAQIGESPHYDGRVGFVALLEQLQSVRCSSGCHWKGLASRLEDCMD